MPEPLSEAAAKRVEELLREGLSAVEVSRRCIGRWAAVTPARVRMEAYRLGIGMPQGRRTGTRMPGVGGRPRGPGKKFSPNRLRAQELRAQGLSLKAISAELGISPQAVSQLLAATAKENS
mgnify:FL=1